jgi:hypothetical protein
VNIVELVITRKGKPRGQQALLTLKPRCADWMTEALPAPTSRGFSHCQATCRSALRSRFKQNALATKSAASAIIYLSFT